MFSEPELIQLSREYTFSSGSTQTLNMREPTTQDVARSLTNTKQYVDDKETCEFENERFLIILFCSFIILLPKPDTNKSSVSLFVFYN